jgi:hypothetical protein
MTAGDREMTKLMPHGGIAASFTTGQSGTDRLLTSMLLDKLVERLWGTWSWAEILTRSRARRSARF